MPEPNNPADNEINFLRLARKLIKAEKHPIINVNELFNSDSAHKIKFYTTQPLPANKTERYGQWILHEKNKRNI